MAKKDDKALIQDDDSPENTPHARILKRIRERVGTFDREPQQALYAYALAAGSTPKAKKALAALALTDPKGFYGEILPKLARQAGYIDTTAHVSVQKSPQDFARDLVRERGEANARSVLRGIGMDPNDLLGPSPIESAAVEAKGGGATPSGSRR